MAVMGVWAFILCTGHRWHKNKRAKSMKQYQADFPGTENKEVFRFTSSESSKRSQFICSRKVCIWLVSLGIQKTMPLATISQKLIHVEN